MIRVHVLCLVIINIITDETESGKCPAPSGVTITQLTEPVEHGEGPHWDGKNNVLYFVDIQNQTVNKYNPISNSHEHVFIEGGPVSLIIPTNKGKFVIARGLELVELTWSGNNARTRVLAKIDTKKPQNRFNDGKADSSGTLWAGTMGPENPDLVLNQASFYSFSSKKKFRPTLHLRPVSVSNGIGWTANDTIMFYVDSPTRKVEAFDFDIIKGVLSNRRPVFKLDTYNISGVPDGLCMDESDKIWVAIHNGGRIIHIDPDTGKLLGTIQLPVDRVTSCAWGGKNLQTLYVTTSRHGLKEEEKKEQPLAGSLFAIDGTQARGQQKSNVVKN